ncbi:DNA mismatch repair endonuclease MutL [Ruminococcus sp. OA3]|uniref:DNA mismatch repair endonuclease MutL n=1 Tax=Ruminococcus sp. OA3 TaxID=2914164 RepID=UPI001F06DC34|nr:DNA mismatch repair endonuclease MutL [Ruminococcus sp. OA3]MCH1983326.1 DNA mismatch repair endonuclease MutL [Ruminococcus sp. OA3]
MNKISLLDQNTIDKIAAGEVVERPSSIVKELVENAVDARSSAITVEIKEGGISFIRITDNGTGIPKEQVPLAFLRHATSKIQTIDDLLQIASLGFRGEALSSIAAVSQVELITKTPDALTGTRYLIEGGIEKGLEEIGAPQGTTFLVRNLFYNTPARAKFLKSPTTEASYIGSIMEQMALSHPEISFKYMQNGQTKLHTSGNGNFREVIYQIYGRDITKDLLEIDTATDNIRITGFIGKPSVSRGNRTFENYYVNGRYVKNKIITKAIEDGFRSFMMQHKFPFTSLFITVNSEHVDVNVHPSKMEVRFEKTDLVYQVLYRAICEALTETELIPEVSFTPKKERVKETSKPSVPEPFEIRRREMLREAPAYTPAPSHTPAVSAAQPAAAEDTEVSAVSSEMAAADKPVVSDKPIISGAVQTKQDSQLSMFEDRKLLSENSRSLHRLIGQVFSTYWLVEMEEKLFIIDQHAAHEKVLYEKMMNDLRGRQITSQYLAVPIIISLNLQQLEMMRRHEDLFRKMGFELEAFGGKEYTIRAVPYNLFGIADETLLVELIDSMGDETAGTVTLEIFVEKLAVMACKAAVKGNQKLSFREAEVLIDQLLTLENPYNCPHGRPTIISMSRYELEKKFKRIV